MSPSGAGQVEFFFDFASPHSYLAAMRVERICAPFDAHVLWRPVLLGRLLEGLGRKPILDRPLEAEYARRDLPRCAKQLGLPFRFPKTLPVDSLDACRGFRFAAEQGRASGYCRAVMESAWTEGRDIARREVLRDVAVALGLDGEEFLGSLEDPEVTRWLRAETEGAVARGVFDCPTFFLGTEMFHGHDRLFMLENELARDRLSRQGLSTGVLTPFNRWFGFRLLEAARGRAEYVLDISPCLLNRRGVAHGGAASSLLDTALGSAVVSGIAPEEWCATLELSVQFRRPLRPGRVTGRGRLVGRGRRAAFAEGEIVDGHGKTLAVAHGTWYIWPSRPGGEIAIPARLEG